MLSGTIDRVLSRGKYDIEGPATQNFLVVDDKSDARPAYEYVSLRIHSNHGNPEYTCLYRFRVHGEVVS